MRISDCRQITCPRLAKSEECCRTVPRLLPSKPSAVLSSAPAAGLAMIPADLLQAGLGEAMEEQTMQSSAGKRGC
eukprot:5591924-Amphidinium_carterae.2